MPAPRDTGWVFAGLHHMQLAMPGGGENRVRTFFVGVLGMTEIAESPVLATTGQDVTWDRDFPGFRRFYGRDQFGNRLEFLQPEEPR
ncbi:MAG TPA: hypothetical protein VFE65_25365 [Pseudonocardia sp.]|nr:hypothetical protein [Pseudonocardia sp.]